MSNKRLVYYPPLLNMTNHEGAVNSVISLSPSTFAALAVHHLLLLFHHTDVS